MKTSYKILLAILVFLAVSSGLTKISLMQHEVDFFAKYGFTNSLLISFGVIQLFSGLLLVLPKTRIVGASILGITFLISAFVLGMSGDYVMTIITLVCVSLLVFVVKQILSSKA